MSIFGPRKPKPPRTHYTMKAGCYNCGMKNEYFNVPIGQAIEDTTCPKCGLKELGRLVWKPGYFG